MHLWCRVCEHIDVNTCTCQAGPALFLWPRSTNTQQHHAHSHSLTHTPSDATHARTQQLSCQDKETIARCLVSSPCSVLCVPACGTDHETIEPAQLDRALAAPAASCRSWERWARVQVQSPVWWCDWLRLARRGGSWAGAGGAVRGGPAAAVCTTHQSGPSHPSVHTAVLSPAQRALATPWYHCAHRSVRARSASSPAALHKLEVKINGKHLRSDSAWPAVCAIGKVKLNKFNNNHQWGAGSQIHTVPHRVIIRPLNPVSEVSVQLGVVICSNDGKTLVMTSSPCHTTTQLQSLEVEFHNLVHHKNGKSDSKCCLMLVTEAEVTKHVPKRLYTTML